MAKRIHPLTAGVAIAMCLSLPIQGAVIGPSAWQSPGSGGSQFLQLRKAQSWLTP
jgi:hypothetical protein